MYLAFYKKRGNIYDRLIRWWTNSKYSHVEIVTDDFKFMYSSSPRDNGVRKKEHIKDDNVWDYVKFNGNLILLENFYLDTKENKYDKLGILGFIIPIKDRTNEWFCSEWCSNYIKISGDKRMWKLEPSKISPGKLYRIITNTPKDGWKMRLRRFLNIFRKEVV